MRKKKRYSTLPSNWETSNRLSSRAVTATIWLSVLSLVVELRLTLFQGLDTPTPFLQLAGTVLKGRHETLLGTELLFSGAYLLLAYGKYYILATEHEHAVSYMESTRQRILFREVRLEEKGKAKAKADACSLVLDRITGKLAPLPRRRRTQKMEVVPEDY